MHDVIHNQLMHSFTIDNTSLNGGYRTRALTCLNTHGSLQTSKLLPYDCSLFIKDCYWHEFCISSFCTVSEDCKLQSSDLKYIMQTLCDLSTWYLLGVYLDVPKGKLDQFHATYGGGPDAVERCKIETVCCWLENAREPTWAKLADAVLQMGRRGIVERISRRCGKLLI